MLAPEEITAGTFASSPAGGLILPRKRHETTAIVGLLDNEPTAGASRGSVPIPLFADRGFRGLVRPGHSEVRVEVDESTAFDPAHVNSPLGTVVRAGTHAQLTRAGRPAKAFM
jgi:hypothetical protein